MIQPQSFLFYPHKKQFRFEFTQKVSLCFNCSSAIITDISGKEISTIKPLKHHLHQETTLPIFLGISDEHNPYHFHNKSGYLKIRKEIVQSMKEFCNHFQLNKKTFFLALEYIDRICSRMIEFDKDALKQSSQICIILACKLQENQSKAMEIVNLAKVISGNYAKDELFILGLLDYNLHVFTSYDILMDILNCGFLFNDEQFSERKKKNFLSIYGGIENILYLFSERNYYIDMTNKEIALSIAGFIRENLGLTAFSKSVQTTFMNEFADIHNYLSCLSKLRKCFKFKIENNNNHSDSNTDSNSDNSSENNSNSNKNKNLNNNNNVNNSIERGN